MLLLAGIAFGNPIPGPLAAHYYISFERLEVTLSTTEAVFKGAFEFSSPDLKLSDNDMMETFMELPVWFPQQSSNDQTVNAFWHSFGTNMLQIIRPQNREVFERAVGLRVYFGKRLIPINGFAMLYEGGNRKPFEFFLSKEWEVLEENQEPGFCCLVFRVDGLGTFVRKQIPMKVFYRQPLFKVKKAGRFFYLPIFENLPKGVSTTDTNHYSIKLTAAPGCCLAVTNGLQTFKVDAGDSITLIPKDRQAIHAMVEASHTK